MKQEFSNIGLQASKDPFASLKDQKKKKKRNPRIQFSSVAQSCPTLWPHESQHSKASLSITNSRSLLKLNPIELVMPSSHLILCRPLLLLPPIPPSIRVFSIESTLHMRWPKYWSLSFSISPSNEHPGLISFRMDWLDILAVQGTLKSLLQHHSSKASVFQCSAYFTGKRKAIAYVECKKISIRNINSTWTEFLSAIFTSLFPMCRTASDT